MMTADLHTLTGAYALHALEPDERAAFEEHLRACPACTQEVDELIATAGRLGLAVTVTPPPALKVQVMRRIATERQEAPLLRRHSRGGGARGGRALSRFALAACLAAAVGFGGIAVWQHQEAGDARNSAARSEQQAQALASVLAAPDAKVTTGKLKGGATGTVVVSHSRNKAAFLASGLPKPPSGKTYQLWFDDHGTMRSAGLLNSASAAAGTVLDGPVDSAQGMGLTVEPAGGSAAPTTAPLALMTFSA
ncbi:MULTISPECIES: anti-sigma factor [unclassified Streptomyces]|uniref:anti-sigma factor n=1 Tax=unclassified Streptomyces TaxID=2593676 RepID=UPI002255FEE6|nr:MULTISPECIES: anti-sigma factor [unclassified Streptomyces]MCX4552110.1 anti-sigma factor [Streptomyces sp. NBC_01500]WSC23453.1 anti-sigma factor [Streptomyces sp. NBC_01766]WSV57363.1 anti-sigma factor [Streptomyces sp. NBC_01014]